MVSNPDVLIGGLTHAVIIEGALRIVGQKNPGYQRQPTVS
jgi:hypothetical protein